MDKITPWEERKKFLNTVDYSTFSEAEKSKILDDFKLLKETLQDYDLCETDEDFERALYSRACSETNRIKRILSEKGLSYPEFLSKLILSEYAKKYLSDIYIDVQSLTYKAPSLYTLTPRQDLYIYRRQISKNNREVIDSILQRYFLTVSSDDQNKKYIFSSAITGESFNLDFNSHLGFVLGRYNDLFDFTKAIDSPREGPVFYYGINYWADYANTLQTDLNKIDDEFSHIFTKTQTGLSEITIYQESLDTYRKYAEGYLFSESDINQAKRKH